MSSFVIFKSRYIYIYFIDLVRESLCDCIGVLVFVFMFIPLEIAELKYTLLYFHITLYAKISCVTRVYYIS